MPEDFEQLARDVNSIAAWLALDDFGEEGPQQSVLDELDVIALLGNQVVATLTAACALAQRAPAAMLVLSGGAGHSTGPLYENLRGSDYGALVEDRAIHETMAEAEMYAVVVARAFAIPAERVLIENRSGNAGENACFSLRALKDADVRQGKVVLLQDPTMQRRSMLTWGREAELAGVDTCVLSHAAFVPRVEAGPEGGLRFVTGQARGTWTLERFVGLVLGEIRRLRDDEDGYGPRGRNFLPHVEIPEGVMESYRRVAGGLPARLAAR